MKNKRKEMIRELLEIEKVDMEVIDSWEDSILANTLEYYKEKQKEDKWEKARECWLDQDEYTSGIDDMATTYVNGVRQRRRSY